MAQRLPWFHRPPIVGLMSKVSVISIFSHLDRAATGGMLTAPVVWVVWAAALLGGQACQGQETIAFQYPIAVAVQAKPSSDAGSQAVPTAETAVFYGVDLDLPGVRQV